MKTTLIIKSILAMLFAGLASIGFAATTKITVNGMVCAFCAQGIEKRLEKLPATKSVFVDLKNKIVAIEAKDGMSLDTKVLSFEITEAGYDVVKVEESKQSVAEIKASLKAKK
jgi:copper chaperone CopZ